MRCREFTMKDAYSFDFDAASLDESYQKMRQAYVNVFRRCGLKVRIVAADTGAMGGSDSEEFMVESEVGEDFIAACPSCSYSANVERAESRRAGPPAEQPGPAEKVETPGVKSIDQLVKFLGVPAEKLIKTVVYRADKKAMAVLIRGDLEVNEAKLLKALGAAEVAMADPATVEAVTGAPAGFAGPAGLKGKIPVLADFSARDLANAVTGANEKDRHFRNMNHGRDWDADSFHDLSLVKQGDACPLCGQPLNVTKGIEVGHIFKLGDRYTKGLGVTVLDREGRQTVPTMGCYGIGVDRTLAAVVEQFSDADGIAFPAAVAPFEVIVTPIDYTDADQKRTADALTGDLAAAGIEVLLDDRDERAGVKFKDADLLGIPVRVTIGPKFLKENKIELRLRSRKETEVCGIPAAVGRIRAVLDQMKEGM
jgi:prolyl-tRNA synthetase